MGTLVVAEKCRMHARTRAHGGPRGCTWYGRPGASGSGSGSGSGSASGSAVSLSAQTAQTHQ